MAANKILGQVQSVSNTGLNFAATGVGQKATAPKSTSPVHNRGLTLGGKAHATSGGGKVTSPKVNAAIHAQNPQPKMPASSHPAVAKNPTSRPGITWG